MELSFTMLDELRHALRSLAQRPLVTTVAVLSLALGIGVNTAIFSLFDQLILRQLAVPNPEELVVVTSPGPRPGSRSTGSSGGTDAIFSYPLFRDLEALQGDGLRLAAHVEFSANVAHEGQTSEADGLLVSGDYFPVLGLSPALGRLFGPQDDRLNGAHPLVILSHDYWQNRFGSDPAVLDDTLIVNGDQMTVVGVAPQDFSGTTVMERPQIFIPLAMAATAIRDPSWNGLTARNNHWLYLFGRLDPGVSREQAEARVNVPFAGLIRDVEYPALRTGMGDRQRDEFQKRRLFLQEGARGRATDRGTMRSILLLMFAVTGLVLAIACANVANLLLARAIDRASEIAVRVSLGASAVRLTRLFLTEAITLGVLGGVGSLLVARLTLDGLMAMLPDSGNLSLVFHVDWKVLAFAIGIGFATSVLYGLFPALHGVRMGLRGGLQTHGSRASASRGANRFRSSMATAQIALATALLGVSGLFVLSLVNLAREELGIRREGLITFGLSPYQNGYTPARARTLFEQVENQLRSVPGVEAVTATTVPLLANSSWGNNVTVEGFDAGPDANTVASTARTSIDYFRTLGIPLIAGREFTVVDTTGSPQVAIVNEAFTRKFQLGTRAVGRRMALGAGGNRPLNIEIIGVVADAKYEQIREPAPPQFVMPYRQVDTGTLTFYVRTSAPDTRPVLGLIPSLVARHDPNLPIRNLLTMDDQIWENTSRDRIVTTLAGAFASLAVALAAIGFYAMLAYGVAQRLREIGVRVALGAQPHDVRWLVLGHVGRIGLAGALIGAALGLGMGRLGQSLLFGVEGYNPMVIGGAVVLALTVAFCAAIVPARRATSVDPVIVLRAE